MTKRALITGIGGQDGSYLTDLLLLKGYEVHGLARHSSVDNLKRIAHWLDQVTIHRGDVTDAASVHGIIATLRPHEIYHMADQDSVAWSGHLPGMTVSTTYGGVVNVLESATRLITEPNRCKIFVPLSATMFGSAAPPQNETTPLAPASPYACAKAAAWNVAKHYRRERGLHVSCGILYNHDSPRRGPNYLLQKVCAAAIAYTKTGKATFGRTETNRQMVGHAYDMMVGAWQMLQQERPDDYVLCPKHSTTLDDLFALAFNHLGLGTFCRSMIEWTPYPERDELLIGDCSKARRAFGFDPRIPLSTLIGEVITEKLKCA